MATIYVKFDIETQEIPYTSTSGLSSSVNFTDYQQSILGLPYYVAYWPEGTEVGTTSNYVETPLIEANTYSFPGLNPNTLAAFQVTNGGNAYEYVAQGAVATGAVTTDPSVANKANAPTTTETFDAITYTWPDYVWVPFQVEGDLFTAGADTVDFNNLTSDQQAAIAGGAGYL